MATVPLSGTNIRFISGVPFSNDYKNTRWFDSRAQQSTYFNGKPLVHQMTEATFQRIEGRNFVKVNKSIDDLWSTNYLYFQNLQYGDRKFYAFVTHLEYKNTNLTHVHFQIDVFQTWNADAEFKPSFVMREHRSQYSSNGQPVVNTIDEGLAYGDMYETVHAYKVSPSFGYKWMVIVAKEPIHNDPDLEYDATTVGVPQPLSYYVLPYRGTGIVANVKDLNIINLSNPVKVLKEIRKNENAVNNIVSMYVTDYIGLNFDFVKGGADQPELMDYFEFDNNVDVEGVNVGEEKLLWIKQTNEFVPLEIPLETNKYDQFNVPLESKLYMSPYCLIVLDDFKGNRFEVKPEHIRGSEFKLYVKGSLGTSNKVAYSVANYNSEDIEEELYLSLEHSLISNKPSDIPIVNDMLAAFIQGNRNMLENQLDSTVWNGIGNAVSGATGIFSSATSGNAMGVVGGVTGTVQGAGNSVLAIQGVEAKLKDIDNTPPSISKMGGNTIFEVGNNYNGIYVVYKQIKHEYRKKLSDFFNMFGYKINEVKIPNFHTRQNWNFVQTQTCTILGNFNNEDLNELKAVYDNGITFWHTDDVGNYALDNEVI